MKNDVFDVHLKIPYYYNSDDGLDVDHHDHCVVYFQSGFFGNNNNTNIQLNKNDFNVLVAYWWFGAAHNLFYRQKVEK